MSIMDDKQAGPIYRVDKFAVPAHGREEFLGRVRTTHELLRTLPGFVQDIVMEQPADRGESSIITLVEWSDEEFIENARAAVAALHRDTNFSPQELFERLGIKAERGDYRRVDALTSVVSAGDGDTQTGRRGGGPDDVRNEEARGGEVTT